MSSTELKDNIEKRASSFSMSNVLLLLYDIFAIAISYFLALWLRFDGQFSKIPDKYFEPYLKSIGFYVLLCVIVFIIFGLYRSIWKFASSMELARLLEATAIVAFVYFVTITIFLKRMPLSYYVFGLIFQLTLTIAVRFAYRLVLLIRSKHSSNVSTARRVMVIGAGAAGAGIIRETYRSDDMPERVVCVIDDDESKWNRIIEGVPVVGGRDSILENVEKYKIEKIYFAIPSAERETKRDILNICQETGCELKSLPGIYQLATGEVDIKAMKDVDVEDLLGRDTIRVDMTEIYNMISGKVVLITGGGGSIGSEIALQVSRHNPKKLIIFDIYENNAYSIQHKILDENPDCPLEVLIGSVRDSRRVNDIFKTYRPDIVYHAAAHKHVPLMEDSPNEAIKNNAIGTYKVAYAAMMYGTKRFVLISTDKAVNPTNIMGASKRLCELVIQSFDKKIKAHAESTIPVLHVHEEDEDSSMYPLAEEAVRKDEEGNPIFTLPGQDDEGYKKAQTEYIGVRFGNVF